MDFFLESAVMPFKKEHGLDLLLGSKVGSTTGIVTHCGQVLAKPHKVAVKPVQPRRNVLTSEYRQQFKPRVAQHAGMDKKPLVSYTPDAYRSRLDHTPHMAAARNASSVSFDGGLSVVHKRRFKTTHQLSYTGEPVDWRSNQGVLSLNTKLYRKSLQH